MREGVARRVRDVRQCLRGVRRRLRDVRRRVARFERREVREVRRWLESTSNLVHVSLLVVLPALFAAVTLISNRVEVLPYLLFPPLASGSYTLFAHPEERYASPRRFVGGLTTGAFCGWAALAVGARYLYVVPASAYEIRPEAVALGLFLTGVVTWGLDVEEPSAYSTALLVHVTGANQFVYVVSVAVSTVVVSGIFLVWRNEFYEERSRYLYKTTGADDHVLVPMHGAHAAQTATFGARLAGAHEAGKVVLLSVVEDEDVAAAERAILESDDTADLDVLDDQRTDVDRRSDAEARAAELAADELERHANRIETRVGVPCEVAVAAAADGGLSAGTVLDTAAETNCDLVVAPYRREGGEAADYLRALFGSDVDVVAFDSNTERVDWKRVMVPVSRANDLAHAMVDYAQRLAGRTGTVSVCTCIRSERERRDAESMLADLVETVDCRCETRVSRSDVESFVERNDEQYDVVVLGASTDRSSASRFLSRPTYERLADVETDVAVVHRA